MKKKVFESFLFNHNHTFNIIGIQKKNNIRIMLVMFHDKTQYIAILAQPSEYINHKQSRYNI